VGTEKDKAFNPNKRWQIALLASDSLREDPDSDLICFIRQFEPFLEKQELWAPEGTWEAAKSCGLLQRYSWDPNKILPAEWDGGVVEITYQVVQEKIEVVIFLIDPQDPTSLYPEVAALKRECVAKKKFFLSTYASAAEWASLMWAKQNTPYILETSECKDVKKATGVQVEVPLKDQSIALIAHDAKKKEMVRFVDKHLEFLAKFKHIWATGTTGWLLNLLYADKKEWNNSIKKIKKKINTGELKEDRISLYISLVEIARKKSTLKAAKAKLKKFDAKVVKDLQNLWDDFSKDFIRRNKLLLKPPNGQFARKVDPLRSGPDGGDVEVAQKIMHDECQKVIFLEDPSTFPPHEADIRLLERASRLPGRPAHPEKSISKKVVCLSDYKSADGWANAWEDGSQYRDFAPVTLVNVLEKSFGIRAILAPTYNNEKTINNILTTTAWYLHALIAKMGEDKDKEGEKVRVVIPAGPMMLRLLEKLRTVKRAADQIKGRIEVPNLVTLPVTGLLGFQDPSQEANVLAGSVG